MTAGPKPAGAEVDLGSLFDDDSSMGTMVDNSLFAEPKIPHLPMLASFGRYEILGRLARGGMAEVYLARDTAADGTARHLVLKKVLPEMEDDQEFKRLFLDEGQLAVRLYHPNVCHVYECGEIEGTAYLAMEWLYGPTLRTLMRKAGPQQGVPVPVGAWMMAQVAAALEYVHHARGVDGKPLNIVHRDVSPHNIMLSWDGEVKLLDFGIAKTTKAGSTAASGRLEGKAGYMSPEQARGLSLDARSDVFALGICLFEVLTGRALYKRDGHVATLTAIVEEPPPSARALNPKVPEALDAIVQKALAKAVEDRYQSAGELQHALEGYIIQAGELVGERRLALLLGSYFNEDEKAPLPQGSAKLTGTFSALSEASSSGVLATFDHSEDGAARPAAIVFDSAEDPLPGATPLSSPGPLASPLLAPPQLPAQQKTPNKALQFALIALLFVVAIAGGLGAAYLVFG